MSEDRYIEFKYQDLVELELTGQRPKGYVADVLRSAKKRGYSVIMTMDAYKAFCAKYDPALFSPKVSRHKKSGIFVPGVEPKPILGPTGLPLATACCGGHEALQTAE